MKKISVLLVALLFTFSLGFAFAGDDTVNPWQGAAQASAKKDKAGTKTVKSNKKEVKKTDPSKVKKKKTEKAEHAGTGTAEKKETAQK